MFRIKTIGAVVLVALGIGQADASPWPTAAERVEAKLGAASVAERRLAIGEVHRLPMVVARPLVDKALGDEDLEVRLMAARTARSFFFRGLGPRVLSWLKSRDAGERIEAVRLLATDLDEESIQAVESATNDAEGAVRREVAIALGRAPGDLSARTTPKLLALLDDAEASVRREAAVSLGRVGSKTTAVALSSHLQDPDSSVRTHVALALGALGEESVIPALVVGLSDPQEQVVAAVARSLGELGSPQSVSGLSSVVERGAGQADSLRALEALVRIDTAESRQVVVDLLAHPDRRHALERSTVAGKAILPITEECLRTHSAEVVEFCGRLHLRSGGEPPAVLAAHAAGKLTDERVLELFEAHAHPDVVVLALEMLSSPSRERLEVGLRYLESVPRLPSAALGPLEAALMDRAKDAPLTVRILAALGRVASDAGSPWLEPHQQSTSDAVKRAAAHTRVVHGAPGAVVLRLLKLGGPVAQGTLDGLSEGARVEQAEALIGLVAQGHSGRKKAFLSVFWALPPGLSPKSVAQLQALLRRARNEDRDALLVPLLRNLSPAKGVKLLPQLATTEHRLAAQLAWFDERLLPLARKLALSSDARTVQLALFALGRWGRDDEMKTGVALVQDENSPYFVRAAALSALVFLTKRGFSPPPVHTPFCRSPAPSVRAQSLRLAQALGASCEGQPLQDILFSDPDVRFRRLAAELLSVQSDPASIQALRRCSYYEPRLEVAEYCEPREFSKTLPPAEHAPPFQRRRLESWSGRVAQESPLWLGVSAADGSGASFALPRLSDRGGYVYFPHDTLGVVDGDWFY